MKRTAATNILGGLAAILLSMPTQAETCHKKISFEHDGHQIAIGQAGYKVLHYSNMPAILLENFNLVNYEQMQIWNDPRKRSVFIDAYVQAILNYRQHYPELQKVIMDNGHGNTDPGAVDNEHGTGKTERDYVLLIRDELSQRLQQEGLTPIKIDYDGAPLPVDRRLRAFGRTANQNGTASDSIYIALHADVLADTNPQRTTWSPPPKPFVYCSRSKKTDLLAENFARHGFDAYRTTRMKENDETLVDAVVLNTHQRMHQPVSSSGPMDASRSTVSSLSMHPPGFAPGPTADFKP